MTAVQEPSQAAEQAPGAEEGPPAPVHEQHLPVSRTARYYTCGGSEGVREIWIVLHGYGQRAASFIESFDMLADENRLIVAPEGLSRFYIRDKSGRRVGASWMTREDREREIADYISYLDALYRHLAQRHRLKDPAVHVLGFSQGAETACRWVALGSIQAAHLVLWAGHFPPDLDLEQYADLFRQVRLTLVAGTSDPLVRKAHVNGLEERMNRHMIPFQTILFEGGHELDAEVLAEVVGN